MCQELTKTPAMLMNETNYKTDYGWTVFIGGHLGYPPNSKIPYIGEEGRLVFIPIMFVAFIDLPPVALFIGFYQAQIAA